MNNMEWPQTKVPQVPWLRIELARLRHRPRAARHRLAPALAWLPKLPAAAPGGLRCWSETAQASQRDYSVAQFRGAAAALRSSPSLDVPGDAIVVPEPHPLACCAVWQWTVACGTLRLPGKPSFHPLVAAA